MGLNKRLISQETAPAGASVVNTENFAPKLYSGNGTSATSINTITGLGFQPDLVWIKNRDNANSHFLTDSVRGAGNYLLSDSTNAEDSTSRFNSFNSDGFTVSTDTNLLNNSSYDYVAWCFKGGGAAVSNTDGSITSTVSANQDAGFSIVKYSGQSGTQTIGHGLDSAPEMIFIKTINASNSNDWTVYNISLGNNKRIYLDETSASVSTGAFNNTSPTSDVFSVGNGYLELNYAGSDYIAYCFHSVDGYQKVGSYTGNATSGNVVTTGFRPRFVIIKGVSGTSAATNWTMVDSVRDTGTVIDKIIYANLSNAETDFNNARAVEFTDTGFELYSTGSDDLNDSSTTYIYLAIA